ncbi:dolichyl-phosphate-mannose---protein mannosyltransferase [Synchytrium microbalum]|uniref:Dolichyl-phosphate-mannose--protein mannosyltransferase n=1 Tax=Synchytrium microbalum TaxID=1806994 RepID=A0A507BVK8_9FUNG|nr:dolichyl-phosphate-mannose---protein mannosyltransferase [Synchytrium microbalum]TPX31191.1 dolichyl-phosphate-mannose---protein mannosyltransferase [Synchytrium microbalum]
MERSGGGESDAVLGYERRRLEQSVSIAMPPPIDIAQVRKRKGTAPGSPDNRAGTPLLDDESKESDIAKKFFNAPEVARRREHAKRLALPWKVATFVLTLLAFATRVWRISEPAQVVFDEVHFGKFASYYLRRQYFFDVHPPLGKLLLALTGFFVGYDGHYLFENIGEDYVANNVPYVALRLFPASCGALCIPMSFLILKEMHVSLPAALFAGLMLVFDNTLITQSRLILLDSMLLLSCVMCCYTWVRFFKERHNAWSRNWWFWLSMTGVALAAALGIKLVGLFVVAVVGIATLIDLWRLLDFQRALPLREFFRHFAARALCLIVLPIIIYLSFFWIHFAILVKSGPGDAFHTTRFQQDLRGSEVTTSSFNVPYGSNVTFYHKETGCFLHSHAEHYPLRYEDGRISSQGQQVTGYPHRDTNNIWHMLPIDAEQSNGKVPVINNDDEGKPIRYVRNGDLVQLLHVLTDTLLITHDVASPLTPTHMEMTTMPLDELKDRFNETLWKVEFIETALPIGAKLKSRNRLFRLVNHEHKVAIHTYKSKLPDWAFNQQEVNGNKNLPEKENIWYVEEVVHETIINGTEMPDEVETKFPVDEAPRMSFLEKVFELQSLMIQHNAGLTGSHPYSSTPITWPFVLRGISFWENKEGWRQIYLLGNPFVWWTTVIGVLMYAAMYTLDRILLRRGLDDLGVGIRRWWDRAGGFMWIAWICHWAPFFLMGRQLFLHHYLPALLFSVLNTAIVFDFIGRVTHEGTILTVAETHHGQVIPGGVGGGWGPYNSWTMRVPIAQWLTGSGGPVYWGFLTILTVLYIGGFYYFSPLTYGTGFPSVEVLRTRKWMSSWDLQCRFSASLIAMIFLY